MRQRLWWCRLAALGAAGYLGYAWSVGGGGAAPRSVALVPPLTQGVIATNLAGDDVATAPAVKRNGGRLEIDLPMPSAWQPAEERQAQQLPAGRAVASQHRPKPSGTPGHSPSNIATDDTAPVASVDPQEAGLRLELQHLHVKQLLVRAEIEGVSQETVRAIMGAAADGGAPTPKAALIDLIVHRRRGVASTAEVAAANP